MHPLTDVRSHAGYLAAIRRRDWLRQAGDDCSFAEAVELMALEEQCRAWEQRRQRGERQVEPLNRMADRRATR